MPRRYFPKYDVRMLRDFINQLRLDVAIKQSLLCGDARRIDPELLDQIEPYRRRRTHRALVRNDIISTRASGDAFLDLVAILRRGQSVHMDRYASALQVLSPLIDDAFFCITSRSELTDRTWLDSDLEKLADMTDTREQSP